MIKHTIRRLARAPMFTGVTLLTVAIAVGANAAVFSVINGVLLKPLPYPDSERLVSTSVTECCWRSSVPGSACLLPRR